jgi:metallo-beta-lactamase class B
MRRIFAISLLLLFTPALRGQVNPDWTTPLPPFQIADNLYYVGSRDLAAYLITTSAGNILINANLESSPPQIRASVEKLGFSWKNTKILPNSQAHFDHMAGAAQILRETHAKDMVMDGDADVVRTGGRTDFAIGTSGFRAYAAARVDRVLHDGDTVTLGDVTLTAHKTAGHTRGCTTWTFRTHVPGEPAGQLRNVVLVGGMSAWSTYRLIDTSSQLASYPGIASDFEHTFATLHALPCDIFLGAHGAYFDLLAKLDRMPKVGPSVFIDPTGYKKAITDAEQTFNAELLKQQSQSTHR